MTNRFLWIVKRELWENRWLWLVPAAIAVVLALAFLGHSFHRVSDTFAAIAPSHAANVAGVLTQPYEIAEGGLMAVGLLLAVIYCVDALYGERRDRSVLLWKSLPVSDAETVLAKLAIPTVVLPLSRPGVIAAMTLLFILSTRELGSSLFLYSSGSMVMAVQLLGYYEGGNMSITAAYSLVQIVLLAAVIGVGHALSRGASAGAVGRSG